MANNRRASVFCGSSASSSLSAADDRPYLPEFMCVIASSSSAVFLLYPTTPRLCTREGAFFSIRWEERLSVRTC